MRHPFANPDGTLVEMPDEYLPAKIRMLRQSEEIRETCRRLARSDSRPRRQWRRAALRTEETIVDQIEKRIWASVKKSVREFLLLVARTAGAAILLIAAIGWLAR